MYNYNTKLIILETEPSTNFKSSGIFLITVFATKSEIRSIICHDTGKDHIVVIIINDLRTIGIPIWE